MLGNLVENAAKYGGGRVFVTVEPAANGVVSIHDRGRRPGHPRSGARRIFARGKRLDTTGKPGTGLGLAIVRDVAEIYGGRSRSRKARILAACSPGLRCRGLTLGRSVRRPAPQRLAFERLADDRRVGTGGGHRFAVGIAGDHQEFDFGRSLRASRITAAPSMTGMAKSTMTRS